MFSLPLTGHAAPGTYDWRLVSLSYVIAALASYATLSFLDRVKDSLNVRERRLWISACSLAMGCGIWSMHFTAMLAHKMPLAVSYNFPITFLSLVFAVAASGYGLFHVMASPAALPSRIFASGLAMGLGVAAMHYTGMAAMEIEGSIHYNPALFFLSIFIAIAAATAALTLIVKLGNGASSPNMRVLKTVSSLVMGIAVAGMHYTGMAATSFISTAPVLLADIPSFDTTLLGVSVGGFTGLILGVTALAAFAHKEFNKLRLTKDELENLILQRTAALESACRELQQKEAALLESQQRLNVALHTVTGGDWEWDLITDKVKFAPRWLETTGYSPDELEPHINTWKQLVHPDDIARVSERLRSYFAGEIKVYDFEYRLRVKSGAWQWRRSQGAPIAWDASGKPVYMIGTEVDLTERKRLEEEREYARRIMQNFIEHTPAPVAMFDRDMRYLAASRRWLTDYKLGAQNIIGRSHYEVFPEIPAHWKEIHQRCLAGAAQECDEDTFVRQDGSLEYIRWVITPWHDQQGVGGIIIFSEVMTERKRAHEDLRKLSLAIRQSLSSVMITDSKGRIEYVNPMFCEVTGYSPAEVIGQTPRILKSGQHPQWFYENLWKTIRDGREWKADICNKKKNGELFWELQSIHPIFGDDGKIINFMSVRIADTERKIAEDRLKHYAEELARSNKDLEDFASIASHDLQEPLRKVLTFGERVLEREKNLSAESKDYLERMQKASIRMKRLIEDLLQFSRVKTKSKPFAPADLNKVIDEVREVLEVKIKKTGGTITVNSLPDIEADYLQMCQLFQNIIANALKFHKEGIPPHIFVEGRESGGNQWEITVKDNGIGFDGKYADRIFKPFERLHGKNAYEGTGIGLAICKKIVDRHHGTIAVKSAPGEGAAFIITLPGKQEG